MVKGPTTFSGRPFKIKVGKSKRERAGGASGTLEVNALAVRIFRGNEAWKRRIAKKEVK